MGKRTPQFSFKSNADKSGEIRVYDVIGDDWFGITAKQVADAVEQFKADGVTRIDVRVNSPGGSAFDGVAIYNVLRQFSGEKTVYVDGLAASAASVVMLAGDRVVMGEGAMVMIHNPAALVYGEASELRKEAGTLDSLRDSVVALYVSRTKQSAEEIRQWMDAETWMDADLAIKRGFADESSGESAEADAPQDDAASMIFAQFKRAPVGASRFVQMSAAKSRVSGPRDAAIPTEEKHAMTDETKPVAAEPAKPEPVAPVNPEIAEMRKMMDELKTLASTVTTTFGAQLKTAAASATAPVVAKFSNKRKIETPDNAILGGVAKAAFRAKRMGCTAIEAAEQMGQQDLADKMQREVDRRMDYSESTVSAGGALVPEETASGIIEKLKAKSVVLSAGARLVTMSSDTLRLPRQSGSGTAAYLGENSAPTPSSATFDQIVMQAKKLAALSVVSNEQLADASIDMQAFIQEDLISACALKMDLAALTGVGTDYEPRGLVSWIDSAHQTQQTGTSFANWTLDLNKLRSALETDSVSLDGCAIFMSPRTKNGFWGLANAAGMNVFRDEMKSAGTLDGFRAYVTSQISTTGAASRVFFVHMPDFVVAMKKEFTIDIGDNYELSGNAKSAFANDQSVVRCIGRHDFALRHPEAGAIIHTVTLA